jgi:hypothetical protein
MNNDVLEFYSKSSAEDPAHPFYEVMFIEQDKPYFEDVHKLAPNLPKGWVELSAQDLEVRKDLIKSYWQARLPFFSVDTFFNRVDDIGLFLTKKSPDSPFEAELVYSLENNEGFIRGFPFLSDKQIHLLSIEFDYLLPSSYLQFLKIHSSLFSHKGEFCSPLNLLEQMKEFHSFHADERFVFGEREIHPTSLIPFFKQKEPKGMQCFITEWSLAGEIGNVFYSEEEKILSPYHPLREGSFAKFNDWLSSFLIS